MVKWIPLFLILFFQTNHSKSQVYLGGSFHAAAICKDGIVVGADSRGVFFKGSPDSVIAYFDTVQKVFIIKNTILSVIGLIAINGRSISSYLNEFESTLKEDISPTELLKQFYNFFMDKYPSLKNGYAQLDFICVGYQHDSAIMCALHNGTGKCAVDSGIANENILINYTGIKNITTYCLNNSCRHVGTLIDGAIRKFAIDHKHTNEIGGPIMIIKISKGKEPKWLANKPRKPNWNNERDLFDSYLKGEQKIHFISKRSKEIIYKHFNCPI